MNWLEAIERRAREAVGIPDAKLERSPRPVHVDIPEPEIKTVWVQTRAPTGEGDPGGAEVGFYSVLDGVLTMHQEDGSPTGQKQRLGEGDDPHQVAGRLKKAWTKAIESDFNRRLNYPRAGYA